MTTKIQLPPNLARHFYEARRRYLQSAGATITPWFQLAAFERAAAEQEIDLVRQAIEAAEVEQAIRDLLQSGHPAGEGASSQPLEDPASTAEEPTAAADDSPTEEPCGCLGCQVRRAIDALLEPPQPDAEGSDEEDCGHPICRAIRADLAALAQSKPVVDAYTNPDLIGTVPGRRAPRAKRVDLGKATVTVVPLDLRAFGVPFTEEELTQLQETAKRSLQEGMPTLVTVGAGPEFLDLTFGQALKDYRMRGAVERFLEATLGKQLKNPLTGIGKA